MKKIILSLPLFFILILAACGGQELQSYEVSKNDTAQQDTVNMTIETAKTDENTVKKIGIDAVSKLDQSKVNGARISFIDSESGNLFAESKIGFNETGLNATGTSKKNIFEIEMK